MALILDILVQGAQMALVLALAPLLAGFVRKLKARLTRRRGPSLLQPYRDLARLLRKEVVLPENASWLFRATPYIVFAPPGWRRRWSPLSRPASCSAGPPI
jgi:formate hydrogenlyase subunit 4